MSKPDNADAIARAETIAGPQVHVETVPIAKASPFQIKRIYADPAPDDGYRVLVDRLWPRGVSRDGARLDLWCKDIAPSPDLRTWWKHNPETFPEFTDRYEAELDDNLAVKEILQLALTHEKVTLLYGARDPLVNHATVLAHYLRDAARSNDHN